jgi:hypothetical protein
VQFVGQAASRSTVSCRNALELNRERERQGEASRSQFAEMCVNLPGSIQQSTDAVARALENETLGHMIRTTKAHEQFTHLCCFTAESVAPGELSSAVAEDMLCMHG